MHLFYYIRIKTKRDVNHISKAMEVPLCVGLYKRAKSNTDNVWFFKSSRKFFMTKVSLYYINLKSMVLI